MSIENPELKQDIEEINKEGWEGNAAVKIGKKEDMPNMVKALETEGKAEDVETYIRLNKQIVIPAEDFNRLNDELDKYHKVTPKIGDFYFMESALNVILIYFFDKNLNLAKVEFGTHEENNKVSSMKDVAGFGYYGDYQRKLSLQMRELGFNQQTNEKGSSIYDVLDMYQREIKNMVKEKTSKEFDF